MIDNYQIQTKSAESYWIFDVSSTTQKCHKLLNRPKMSEKVKQ